jgi:hypothetical protein
MSSGGIGWRRGYGVSRRRGRITGPPPRPRSAATAASTCFRHWRSAAVAWSGGRSAARPPATSSRLAADPPQPARIEEPGHGGFERVARPRLWAGPSLVRRWVIEFGGEREQGLGAARRSCARHGRAPPRSLGAASCSRGDNSCAFGVRPSICRRAREYHISLERRRGFRRHLGVHNRSGATQVSLRLNLRTLRERAGDATPRARGGAQRSRAP